MALYNPPHFQAPSMDLVRDALRRYAFATFLTVADDGELMVSHIPVIYDEAEGRLRAHVARRSDHWRWIDGQRASMFIVHGPHSYVSSSWYEDLPSGSTWNYLKVHVHGVPRLLETADQLQLVRDLTERLDDQVGEREIPQSYIDGLQHAFVAFEMPIERIEAKFKMSQNRSDRDRRAIAQQLRSRDVGEDAEVAEWVEWFLNAESDDPPGPDPSGP